MSKNYSINIPAHNSIYINNYEENNYSNRKLLVKYSEPDEINAQTGILLLIPGYGAHISSNVYNKMREVFSEQYNLIVLQCDFLGSEFMQALDYSDVLNYFQNNSYSVEKNNNTFSITTNMSEDEMNLNDMGPMQAIDNITAVLAIIERTLKQGTTLNTKKVMIYGQSHGAYLAYLCNRFCPNVFQLIIENSAYTFPVYIDHSRILAYNVNEYQFQMHYRYLISKYIEKTTSRSLYSLNNLYSNFDNSCYIISYHGTNDLLISMGDKHNFTKDVNKMIFIPISDEDIDGTVISSCDHGLDCDFLKLFDMTYQSFQYKFFEDDVFMPPKTLELKLDNSKYFCIDYDEFYPRIKINHSTSPN